MSFVRSNPITPGPLFREFRYDEVEQSLSGRFQTQVDRCPDRIAVKTDGHSLTYRQLAESADRVAGVVARHLDAGNAPVVLLMSHDAPLIAAILGVLKAGQIYTPVDPTYPVERNRFIVRDCQASLLLTDSAHSNLANELKTGNCVVVDLDKADAAVGAASLRQPCPEDLAYLIYTSGSTGQPKGVLQTHRNALHNCMVQTNTVYLSPADRLTLLYSCSVMGSVRGIFNALLNGAMLCPRDMRVEGLTGMSEWLNDTGITVYHSVPTVFRHFASSLTPGIAFPSLRLAILGGERVLVDDVKLMRQFFTPECVLYSDLGSTETGTVRHLLVPHDLPLDGTVVPLGYPVDGMDISLLNDEGHEVNPGEVGEIAIKSRYLSPGYLNRPDDNTRVFLQASPAIDTRVYMSGDLGKFLEPDLLAHVGRKDSQVKIRGFRVEAAEIEHALLAHPVIKEAIVLPCEDERSDVWLAAYLIARTKPEPDSRQIRTFLRERLPEYMLPARFMFFDSFPQTPNGKTDRRALPLPCSPACEAAGSPRHSARTATEQVIAQVWSQVLGRPQVGVHDNFFDLGGHSLSAAQISVRLREALRKDVPLFSIFDAPTVAELSQVFDKAKIRGPERGPDRIMAVARDAYRTKRSVPGAIGK
jgi:amino acid adenylation domain-containing protein